MDIGSNTVSCLNRRKNTKSIKKSKNTVDNHRNLWYKYSCDAEVAELADAQASGACGSNTVWVQVPSSALETRKASQMGCFFVSKRLRLLNPWVQGLLAINGSSVGSVGKRSTGPFSDSTSPHLPQGP